MLGQRRALGNQELEAAALKDRGDLQVLGWLDYKANAAGYEELLRGTVIPGIGARSIAGFRHLDMMRRDLRSRRDRFRRGVRQPTGRPILIVISSDTDNTGSIARAALARQTAQGPVEVPSVRWLTPGTDQALFGSPRLGGAHSKSPHPAENRAWHAHPNARRLWMRPRRSG